MDQAADGNESILAQRLAAIAGRLHGRALQHTGNETDADDLVQMTVLRALERGEEHQNGHFEGWLFTVMRNLWIDECRRRNSHPGTSMTEAGGLDALPAPDVDPSATLKRDDLLAFPGTLREMLAADGQTRLVRFMDAVMTAGPEKQDIADAMDFSEVRSVVAYFSDVRIWCREHGVKKEHWLGIMIALAWANGARSRAGDSQGNGAFSGEAAANFYRRFLLELPSTISRGIVHSRGDRSEEDARRLPQDPEFLEYLAGKRMGWDYLVGLADNVVRFDEQDDESVAVAVGQICLALLYCHESLASLAARRALVRKESWRQTEAFLAQAWRILRNEPMPDADILVDEMSLILAVADSIHRDEYLKYYRSGAASAASK